MGTLAYSIEFTEFSEFFNLSFPDTLINRFENNFLSIFVTIRSISARIHYHMAHNYSAEGEGFSTFPQKRGGGLGSNVIRKVGAWTLTTPLLHI